MRSSQRLQTNNPKLRAQCSSDEGHDSAPRLADSPNPAYRTCHEPPRDEAFGGGDDDGVDWAEKESDERDSDGISDE